MTLNVPSILDFVMKIALFSIHIKCSFRKKKMYIYKIFLDKFPGAVKISPFCLVICTSFSHMVLFVLLMDPFIYGCRLPVFVNSLDDPAYNYPYAEPFRCSLKKVL